MGHLGGITCLGLPDGDDVRVNSWSSSVGSHLQGFACWGIAFRVSPVR